MAAIQHVIWDWNGTLLDDVSLSIETFNSLLSERDLPQVDLQSYRDHYGMPIRNYYLHLGFDLDREPFETLGEQFIQRYERRVHECPLHRRIEEIMGLLCSCGLSHSILSAHPENELKRAVSRFELHQSFERIYGSRLIAGGDKLARGFELLEDLELEPEECFLIGDTTSDGLLAQKLGTRCALIAHGHHSAKRLETIGVKVLADFADPAFMDTLLS